MIALLGVLAIAVSTMTFTASRSHIEVAAEKVRSDLEHARSLAMTNKGTTYGVFFDDSNDRYTAYQTSVATPIPDPQTKQNLIETFSRWSGVSITGGNYTVEFNLVGSPTTGGGGNVQITDGANTKTIAVTVNTGRITVQ